MTNNQWQNFLLNLGNWEGSFTRFSPQGEEVEDTPTLVTFEELENGAVRQMVHRFPKTGDAPPPLVLEYRSVNRGTLFFQTGAFSTGSMQLNTLGDFGAELGFISGDRRMRLVELFNACRFSQVTLIREYRQGTNATENPPLTVEQLLGDWEGEAVTLYPDWRSIDPYPTKLSLRLQGNELRQQAIAPNLDFTSTATIDRSILRFGEGENAVNVILLPDGASCTVPMVIPRQRSFFLEAGWLINPTLRQRMIRSYDNYGGWVSTTLVTECKVS
ncbi:MAG TPA: DUF3598 family protein [Oscillatoriales cyanobacterium M59_W2019_021]|nr:DUF3598 family protein [Oscillatoriales cyanobacterium M4454_W2019_049]HIK50159.1 DUF3598 family protein [Oscillatoriales cyanobacterium M59_W2019_021]